MPKLTNGLAYNSNLEAMVCPVNNSGRIEKSISASFFRKFPSFEKWYFDNFKTFKFRHAYSYSIANNGNIQVIITAITKRSWHGMYRVPDLKVCFDRVAEEITELGVKSVAIPAIGYKLKQWPEIKEYMLKVFDIPGVYVEIMSLKGWMKNGS